MGCSIFQCYDSVIIWFQELEQVRTRNRRMPVERGYFYFDVNYDLPDLNLRKLTFNKFLGRPYYMTYIERYTIEHVIGKTPKIEFTFSYKHKLVYNTSKFTLKLL